MTLLSDAVVAEPVQFTVREDGRFDVVGTTVRLLDCYPALDARPVEPKRVTVAQTPRGTSIDYTLPQGALTLEMSYQGDTLAIQPLLSGLSKTPGVVSVIHHGKVAGAGKVYRTPGIISGQGGVKDWPTSDTRHSECYAVTGLLPLAQQGRSLVVASRDYRKYLSYAYLHPTKQHNGSRLLDVSVRTEDVAHDSLPAFYVTEHESPFNGMRSEAQAVAVEMGVKPTQRPSYHWCSWYFSYYHLTSEMVSEYLRGFAGVAPPLELQTFQIDAGYFPHVGDWLEPSHKFPEGLGPAAKEILAHGYRAGIWIAPYMVGNRSKVYAEHPDWVLRRNDGSPIVQMKFYGEERLWGLMDEEVYVLDTSNPAVMDHLRNVFRTFRKQGFTFFKTDFMYYGWESSNSVQRFTPGKTSSEHQRELFAMIRREIGAESYWLGCIAPFPVMLGYVDGMRIAGDIQANWGSFTNMLDESIGAQHINNVWWQNDPDSMILRSRYSNLTDEETEALAIWMGMLGGVINTSDLLHEIPRERVELFRFLAPGPTKRTSRLPFATTPRNFEVLVREAPSRRSWAVYFLNRHDEKKTDSFTVRELTGVDAATCFRWDRHGADPLGDKDALTVDLAPHQGQLMFLSTEGKAPSTDRLSGE
ncbi:MAG: glycoside hydrolase family 36 protein [Lacipirellulaceae bacterium]